MSFVARNIAKQLRQPSTGFWAYLTRKIILNKNASLEEETFKKLRATESDAVLELGFGFGSGLSYALDTTLRAGSGKLYGVDYSLPACDAVKEMLKDDVKNGKVEIHHSDVSNIPIEDNSIDKAFHTNCYYFWPDMEAATAEIKRVIKPGGVIIAGCNMNSLARAQSKGLLEQWQFQPDRYMSAMQNAGFVGVCKEEIFQEALKAEFTFMLAVNPE